MDWTPDLSVGVEMIDEQHKELIRRMNDFYQSVKSDDREKVFELLKFMSDYVTSHFREEEALQQKYNNPDYAEHRKLHQGFEKDVRQLEEDIRKNYTVATKSLVGMTLMNWLMLHIMRVDKKLGEYIRSRG
jgi:hemerythrin